MPGVQRLSIAEAVREAGEAAGLGLAAVLLFGLPAAKDAEGSAAWDEEGVVQTCVRAIKQAYPELLVMTDVCLCEYTDHGHCGFVLENGEVDNDATLELYARTAVSQAAAGADIIAPSGMMDGQVAAIRDALDTSGLHRHGDPRLQREVRLRALRALPRRRRMRTAAGRPALATRWTRPTSARQCARRCSTSRRVPTW